ncbi:MAG TPA: LLM class F420-dependent oxidoreductase [Myxococcota bacterium]|jgi:probable F420-dependent oxidoreductase|nr:LLM class F420-dependent oxidoreductase [Myxococcota bacterium]
MKFGLMFANVGPFAQPEGLAHLARTAEDAGFESIWTVEHVVVPVGYRSAYPYSPSGRMPGPEDSPIPDPVLPLAYVAALTTRLRLGTGVMILPQRHPAYVAKEAATLDVLSKGRALLGVGIGWLREEFETLGVPFEERVGRTEESIRAIRSLWAAKPAPFEGRYFRWSAVESNPKPVQAGGVPIVVGGHVPGAARRAARLGDGFFPARGDLQTLPGLLAELRDECTKVGRDPAKIEITTGGLLGGPDDVKRYADLGVSRLVTGPPAFDREGIERGLHEFADRVIAKS